VGQAVYAIAAFPDDDLLWRIEWIGGVGYNTSVPSEPQIDVCLAAAPQRREEPAQRTSCTSRIVEMLGGIPIGRTSRRRYIEKADGRQRPLGIAALEDKIVQRAVVEVLNAILFNIAQKLIIPTDIEPTY
jgi:hypothetical protein